MLNISHADWLGLSPANSLLKCAPQPKITKKSLKPHTLGV